jgi:hypothetical protein
VTRVTLAKSDKPDASASAVAPTTGSSTTQGCGPTRAPVFDVIVFFEHSHVPATLDDVGVAGAGAGAGSSSTTASTPASTTASTAAPAGSATPSATPTSTP